MRGRRGPSGRTRHLVIALVWVMLVAGASVFGASRPATAATDASLTRYPYLTDSIQNSITVNWATSATATSATVKWGPAGGTCDTTTTTATKTNISVNSVPEYQWKAVLAVSPDTNYCYRVFLNSVDLLGSDPSPTFTSQVAAGSTTPFSFAVFGDWGQAYANSSNPDQANVQRLMSQSGARFAVMTGDTAYPGGDQTNYGDLQQTGTDISSVFAPQFWGVPGRSIPVFNVTGNHGFTNGTNQVVNWPEGSAAADSNGKYLMENYPSINGSTSKNYPSFWYAFDAGPARFYVLTTSWADGNVGSGDVYANDAAAHWTPSSAEYQWLANDLATHQRSLKFAFWHYPLYADSSGQPSDTSIQGGPGTLQGLLDANNVNIAFNGHAHGYERNAPDSAGLVSYVFGNGGAALGSVSGCRSFDLYAIGASGSHCGAAPAPASNANVFGFAKVTVNGQQVTVTPTDSLGNTYDVKTYTFPSSEPDNTPPSVPMNVRQPSPGPRGQVNLAWDASTDNVGVTGYSIYRDGNLLAEQPGTGTTYADTAAAPATTYSYQILATDAAGNSSALSTAASITTTGPADVQAPTPPGNLTATTPSSSQVNLSWTASTDDVRVIGYEVSRDGTVLTSLPDVATTYSDQNAQPGTTATYSVRAFDATGNDSTPATVTATTPSTLTFAPTDDATIDASNPTVNAGTSSRITVDASPVNDTLLKFTVAGVGGITCPAIASAHLRLTVGNTANDNAPNGGDFRGAVDSNWSESTVTWNSAPAANAGPPVASIATPVELSTAYLVDVSPLVSGNGTFTIRVSGSSADGARYYSRNGNDPSVAPELEIDCGGDTIRPSAPGQPTVTGVTSTTASLSWPASTDNVGVTGYRIFRDGNSVGTTNGTTTTFQDTGLSPGTVYSYTVTASDAANNQSLPSPSVTATTPTIPGPPTSVTASGGHSQATVSWTAPASDGGSPITGYFVIPYIGGAAQPARRFDLTATQEVVTGLANGTTYTFQVAAINDVGTGPNSAASNAVKPK